MYYTITIILKAQIVAIGIVAISSFIEMISDLKLLIWGFTSKKNIDMAHGDSVLHAILYFLICLCTMLYDRFIGNNTSSFNFWIWLLIVIALTILVKKISFKLTPKDPDRGNFDFSD